MPTQEGGVCLSTFEKDQLLNNLMIGQFDGAVFRLAQSLTGSQLSVSVAGESKESSVVLVEREHGWEQRAELE